MSNEVTELEELQQENQRLKIRIKALEESVNDAREAQRRSEWSENQTTKDLEDVIKIKDQALLDLNVYRRVVMKLLEDE